MFCCEYTPVLLLVILGVLVYSAYQHLSNLRYESRMLWVQIEREARAKADLAADVLAVIARLAPDELPKLKPLSDAQQELLNSLASPLNLTLADTRLTPLVTEALDFMAMQTEFTGDYARLRPLWSGVQSRMAYVREAYNRVVSSHNTSLSAFPNQYLAPAFGFTPLPYFSAEHD